MRPIERVLEILVKQEKLQVLHLFPWSYNLTFVHNTFGRFPIIINVYLLIKTDKRSNYKFNLIQIIILREQLDIDEDSPMLFKIGIYIYTYILLFNLYLYLSEVNNFLTL